MTVRELIELNQMIGDIEITIRKDGKLLDQLNIGQHEGIKPRYPTMVPKEERYIGTMSKSNQREAHYIPKSINAKDDGKEYYQIMVGRIPKAWLELTVQGWDSHRAYRSIHSQHELEALRITTLPSGQRMEVQSEPKKSKEEDGMDGQMDIMQMFREEESK